MRLFLFCCLFSWCSLAASAHTVGYPAIPHPLITARPLVFADGRGAALPATITIETMEHAPRQGLMAAIPRWFTSDFAIVTVAFFAGGLFLLSALQMRVTLRQLRTSQRMLQDLAAQQTHKKDNVLISETVAKLCDRNQLARLAAIHALGQSGLDNSRVMLRVSAILEAYIRAITGDADLKKSAKAEVLACLRELSNLNAAALQQNVPLTIDLSRVNLAGLPLRHLNLRGADLQGCSLEGALLAHVDMQGALFSGAILTHSEFRHCLLEGADNANSDWSSVLLVDCQGNESVSLSAWRETVAKSRVLANTAQDAAATFLQAAPPLDKSKLH